MGLFFSSNKKSAVKPGMKPSSNDTAKGFRAHQFDHNSIGRIDSGEMKYVQEKLNTSVGYDGARRIIEKLKLNTGQSGSNSVSARDADNVIRFTKGLSAEDANKARDVLKAYE